MAASEDCDDDVLGRTFDWVERQYERQLARRERGNRTWGRRPAPDWTGFDPGKDSTA